MLKGLLVKTSMHSECHLFGGFFVAIFMINVNSNKERALKYLEYPHLA